MRFRKKAPLHSRVIYAFTRAVTNFLWRVVWRADVRGLENVPREGGVLLAANHASLFDPPVIGGIITRTMYFFAKEELFRLPVVGPYIRHLNAFPVKRFSHDVAAFKQAQHVLENGFVLLVFPEGRRSKTGDLGPAKPGVGMLAYKTRVPVVPIYLHNTTGMKRLARIRVIFGKPMLPPPTDNEKEEYQRFSDAVLAAIADLKSKMI